MPAHYRQRIEASRPMFHQRVREEYGLELNPGPMEIDTRPALRVEQWAISISKGHEFHDEANHAYWLHGRDLSQPDVLREIAASVGLPVDDFDSVLVDPAYEQAVQADINQAQMYGLTGVPASVFNNKYLISGAQPYAEFEALVRELQDESGSAV
jgi:predicted DsbA family dithiol-disulfide isomerase